MSVTLTDEEQPVVARALRRALRRGWVEYDPTHLVRLSTQLDRLLTLTAPARHALLDVLTWTNSKQQKESWPPEDLKRLQAVRSRVERNVSSQLDTEGPEVAAGVAPEQPEWTLW